MEAVRRSRQRSADNRKRRYSFSQSIPRCSAILRYLSLVRLTSLAYFAFLGSSAGVRPFFFASANIRSCRSRLSTIADDPVSSCRCFTDVTPGAPIPFPPHLGDSVGRVLREVGTGKGALEPRRIRGVWRSDRGDRGSHSGPNLLPKSRRFQSA